MRARLVRRAGRARLSSTSVRAGPLRIGRDPRCGLVVDRPRVSRHHAEIREQTGRHTVVDLGSTNGTAVNGRTVGSRPVPLRDGDRIEIADEVAFVYEVVRGPELVRPGFGFAALGVLTLLFVVSRPSTPGPERADELARSGQDAALRADWNRASEDLGAAAALLAEAGPLSDLPPLTAQRLALEELTARTDSDEDLWALLQSARVLAESPFGPEPPGCRLDGSHAAQGAERETADSEDADPSSCIRERIAEIASRLGCEEPPPSDFDAAVAEYIQLEHDALARDLDQSGEVRRQIARALEAERFPLELAYLAVTAPGPRDSDSPGTTGAGARRAGVWRFSPGTARRYGLRVSEAEDERLDPDRSSRAAGHYLRDLAFELGTDSFLLAAAGYGHEAEIREGLEALGATPSQRRLWLLWERGLLGPEITEHLVSFFSRGLVGLAGLPPASSAPLSGADEKREASAGANAPASAL